MPAPARELAGWQVTPPMQIDAAERVARSIFGDA
jgi:hypothetical protein